MWSSRKSLEFSILSRGTAGRLDNDRSRNISSGLPPHYPVADDLLGLTPDEAQAAFFASYDGLVAAGYNVKGQQGEHDLLADNPKIHLLTSPQEFLWVLTNPSLTTSTSPRATTGT